MVRSRAVDAWENIKALLRERKYAEAQIEADQQISRNGLPSKAGLLFVCARIYRENREFEKAIMCWERFFSVNPENYSNIDALNEMAVCYARSHQLDEALRLYEQLLAISPRDKYALFGKSLVLMRQGQHEETIRVLREALSHFPDDTRLTNQYAKALQHFAEHEIALEWYKKALTVDPDNFFSWSGIFMSLKAMDRKEEAEKALSKLNALAGKDIRALDRFVRGLLREDDAEMAAEFLEAISNLRITDSTFLRLAGDVYIEQGNRSHEVVYYKKALDWLLPLESQSRIPPAAVLARIGSCYLQLGNEDKAEEYLRKAIPSFRRPIWVHERRLIHKTGEQLLDFKKAELAIDYFTKLLGEDPDDQYGLDGLARAYRMLGRYEESIKTYEKKLVLNKDDIYALDGLARTYRDMGELEKAVETLERISMAHEEERGELEKRIALIRSDRIGVEIEQFNQRKLSAFSTMTSGISHEMNQPLAIIRWNVSSLLRDIENRRVNMDQLRQTLDKVDYQAKRINEILQTFKELSREHPLILQEVDLNGTVKKTFDMFSNQLKIRNISVNLHRLSPSIPTILGDQLRLEQILMNLILNARDALQERSEGLISCQTRIYGRPPRRWVVISFQDNGPGIPDEIRERIYDPFFTTKPLGRGTGLGLSIVFQYMQDMRGRIELDQTYVDGARFMLRFRPFEKEG